MLPDLNRLKVFYNVYRLKSFNQAAGVLHITQPGVSQHIRKLESEIKTPLFTRLHKKIVPTLAADRLFEMVAPFLAELSRELETIALPMDEPFGLLRIGAPPEFGKTYLPEICHKFRTMFSSVRFRVKLDEQDVLLEQVAGGDLDMALMDYFSDQDQFQARNNVFRIEPFLEETLTLACSSTYFNERVKGDVSFEHLTSLEYISDEHEPVILRHWFWHYYGKSAADLNIIMSIDSHLGVLNCIQEGMGLGLTSNHLVWEDIREGRIKAVEPGKEAPINKIALASLAGKKMTLTEETFLDFFRHQMARRAGLKNLCIPENGHI